MIAAEHTLSHCAAMAARHLSMASDRRTEDAAIYLAHVEGALPLRTLATASGRPLTSVHRAVRRIESLREDPLVDRAFEALGAEARAHFGDRAPSAPLPERRPEPPAAVPALDLSAHRALARLAEAEAFLLVATGAEKAGVFGRTNRFRRPLHLLPVALAADFAARDWVRCVSRTAASAKYILTPVGRAFLRRGSGEVAASPALREMGERIVAGPDGAAETLRVNLAESPVTWLARRRGPDGEPLLGPVEVEAAERLRDDFERAQMGPRVTQDWSSFLVPREQPAPGRGPAEGPAAARARVTAALADLGPGLSDVALRVCCFLEGLETVESRMGWSARSGKVVLKIALQRLAQHYGLAPASPP